MNVEEIPVGFLRSLSNEPVFLPAPGELVRYLESSIIGLVVEEPITKNFNQNPLEGQLNFMYSTVKVLWSCAEYNQPV